MLYKSNSPRETFNIAKAFAKSLNPGDVLCLNGDLGVGKTAFVQGIAEGLNIDEYISSPTFTILNCYKGRIPLYHFDVYRIDECDEIFEVGYEDYVYGDGVAVIEWSEIISDILPDNRYEITITKNLDIHDDYREILIEKKGK